MNSLNKISHKPLGKMTSSRRRVVAKGKKSLIYCDWGVVDLCCEVMKRSGYGLENMRGYDPFKDKEEYDRVLLFERGHEQTLLIEYLWRVRHCKSPIP